MSARPSRGKVIGTAAAPRVGAILSAAGACARSAVADEPGGEGPEAPKLPPPGNPTESDHLPPSRILLDQKARAVPFGKKRAITRRQWTQRTVTRGDRTAAEGGGGWGRAGRVGTVCPPANGPDERQSRGARPEPSWMVARRVVYRSGPSSRFRLAVRPSRSIAASSFRR